MQNLHLFFEEEKTFLPFEILYERKCSSVTRRLWTNQQFLHPFRKDFTYSLSTLQAFLRQSSTILRGIFENSSGMLQASQSQSVPGSQAASVSFHNL